MNKLVLAGALLILGYVVGPLPLIFGSILFYSGYCDWKKHEVPDILTAGLWVTVFFIGLTSGINFSVIVGAFAFLYLITVIAAMYNLSMGWADVLALPPFFGVMLTYGNIGIVATAIGLILFDITHRKNGGPLFPFLMIAFWCVAILHFVYR